MPNHFRRPNLERLQTLADWLASGNVPFDRFDMAMWGHYPEPDSRGLPSMRSFCGCAVGWGMKCPALVEQGFKTPDHMPGATTPTYQNAVGWCAVETFFQLGYLQAQHLFNDRYGKRTIKQEIKILRDFIEDHRGFERARAHAAWLAFYAKLPLALPAPIPVQAEPATESAHTNLEFSTN